MTLPTANALWVGPKLGPIHAACLKSFVRLGQRIVLHVYDRPPDVPDGVELADASLTVPRDRLFVNRRFNSYGPFSDLFRYELLSRGAELYVDCDVYCLKPIQRQDYILGYMRHEKVNGAVLALPADSEILQRLLAAARDPYFDPPWRGKRKSFRATMRRWLGLRTHVEDLPYNATGPDALTYYVDLLGLHEHVAPADVYYPLHYERVDALYDSGLSIEDLTTRRSVCLHLYSSGIQKRLRGEIPKGSPLDAIMSTLDDAGGA